MSREPQTCTTTFSRLKYLGFVEILESLMSVPSPLRTDICSYAVNKILQRYNRSNFWQNHTDTQISQIEHFVGRSPISPWLQQICDVHVSLILIYCNATKPPRKPILEDSSDFEQISLFKNLAIKKEFHLILLFSMLLTE